MADINSVLKDVLAKSEDLGKTIFKKYAKEAASDVKAFLDATKDGVARAIKLRKEKAISEEDFEDLILGKKDLAEMEALKQTGLATAALDTFINGVLQILLDAALAAI